MSHAPLTATRAKRPARAARLRAVGGQLGRWEPLAGALAALASAVLVGYMARDSWFYADAWGFLTFREIGSIDSLLRPHAGHWTTPAVVLYRVLYGVFGLDFWPWYFLPRLLGWSVLCFLVWRVLRWRGTDPWLAAAVYGVLLFFGASAWHATGTVGNLIVYGCLLSTCLLVTAVEVPRRRHLLGLSALLLVAVASSGLGVAALVATAMVVLVVPRLRTWSPALVAPTLIYIAWYAFYRLGTGRGLALSLPAVLDMPHVALEILANASRRVLAAPDGYGPALALGVIAALVVVATRQRLTSFDGILLATLAVYLGLVIIVRVHAGQATTDADRYAHDTALLLLLVLLPQVRLAPGLLPRAIALGLVAAVGMGNVVALSRGIRFYEQRAQASRPIVESAAHLIAAGEPFAQKASIDAPRAGMLTAGGLATLVADGWNPPRGHAATTELARAQLRIGVHPGRLITGHPPIVREPTVNGCLVVEPSEAVTTTVTGAGTVSLQAPVGGEVALEWRDRHGRGERRLTLQQPPYWLELAKPDSAASFTLRATNEYPVTVCGVKAVTLR